MPESVLKYTTNEMKFILEMQFYVLFKPKFKAYFYGLNKNCSIKNFVEQTNTIKQRGLCINNKKSLI